MLTGKLSFIRPRILSPPCKMLQIPVCSETFPLAPMCICMNCGAVENGRMMNKMYIDKKWNKNLQQLQEKFSLFRFFGQIQFEQNILYAVLLLFVICPLYLSTDMCTFHIFFSILSRLLRFYLHRRPAYVCKLNYMFVGHSTTHSKTVYILWQKVYAKFVLFQLS